MLNIKEMLDMYLWNKAIELAVDLYQINHADELKTELANEEFGHLLTATMDLMTIQNEYNLDLYPDLKKAINKDTNNEIN